MEREVAAITDRAINAVAARALKEDQLSFLCRSLDRLVDELGDRFADDPTIEALHSRLRTARAAVRIADETRGQPTR